MSLRDVKFQFVYDSDQDDILNDFYIPVLSKSVRYRRLAGTFSSRSLATAARGISKLITNGGIMQLIVGAELRPKDVEAIIRGKSKDDVIAELMINDLKSIEDLFIKDHIKALAWMVANEKIEIKVAIAVDQLGVPLDSLTAFKGGIFHPKIGIFEDAHGNIVTFGGSINESMRGWLYNDEYFYVFPGWIQEYKKFNDHNIKKFEASWNDALQKYEVMDVPTAYRNELIKIAPKNSEDIELNKWSLQTSISGLYHPFNPNNWTPWACQQRALDAFIENNYKGILKMATGTGKTACALFVIEYYLKHISRYGNKFLIIVPSGKDRIGGQWESFLRENASSNDFVFRYDSEISRSERKDIELLWKKMRYPRSNVYVISTIQSLDGFPFSEVTPNFVIADEVHEYGTSIRMNIIKNRVGDVPYILGLSATPERFYDPVGTSNIINYFGEIIFNYSIKDAQNEEKRPGEETVLANYLYNLSIVRLTDREENRVMELTRQIGMNIEINDDPNLSDNTSLSIDVERLLQRRARIIKTAHNKLNALNNLLRDKRSSLTKCIVYCEDTTQLNLVEEVFNIVGITSYVKYHYNIETRSKSLDLFKENDCNFILSINCLDQGVNIPDCQSLILLSSSTNPRQYIQRRGRVLRNYKGKPLVHIYDIMAFPNEIRDGYKGLVMSQLLRAWEFIDASQSPEEQAKIIDLRRDYEITTEELNLKIKKW